MVTPTRSERLDDMIERLVPRSIASMQCQNAETHDVLLPVELKSTVQMSASRLREFTNGRSCARIALHSLGYPEVALPRTPRGAPLWPKGLVGSITHCAGFCAAVAAHSARHSFLGIDAEINEPLPVEVLPLVATDVEMHEIRFPARSMNGADVGRLIFSAKESAFKAWYPRTGEELDFLDIAIQFDSKDRTFRVIPQSDIRELFDIMTSLQGRWAFNGKHIVTVAFSD